MARPPEMISNDAILWANKLGVLLNMGTIPVPTQMFLVQLAIAERVVNASIPHDSPTKQPVYPRSSASFANFKRSLIDMS